MSVTITLTDELVSDIRAACVALLDFQGTISPCEKLLCDVYHLLPWDGDNEPVQGFTPQVISMAVAHRKALGWWENNSG